MRKFFNLFINILIFNLLGNSLLYGVTISAATKKDKAYYTCRYEVKKLLDTLEEFDNTYAKITYAKLKKSNNKYFVSCKFINLIGQRGVLRFPIKKIHFKYDIKHKKSYDFILDGKEAGDWVVYIGIFHN